MEINWEDAGENTMNENIIWEKQFEFDKHYQGTHKSSKPRQTMGRAGCSWIWPSWNIVAFFTAIQLIISMVSFWANTSTELNTYILMCRIIWKIYGFKYQEKLNSLTTKPQAHSCSQFSSLQTYLPIKKKITVSRGGKNSVSPKTCLIYGAPSPCLSNGTLWVIILLIQFDIEFILIIVMIKNWF